MVLNSTDATIVSQNKVFIFTAQQKLILVAPYRLRALNNALHRNQPRFNQSRLSAREQMSFSVSALIRAANGSCLRWCDLPLPEVLTIQRADDEVNECASEPACGSNMNVRDAAKRIIGIRLMTVLSVSDKSSDYRAYSAIYWGELMALTAQLNTNCCYCSAISDIESKCDSIFPCRHALWPAEANKLPYDLCADR